eukprot:Ihof_evm1s1388 gene=Ihof_evmTU1s1388
MQALQRLYGDKVDELINGLRTNPQAAIPVVIRRVKQKQEDWRRAQKDISRQEKESQGRSMLKSLDYQGQYFKNNERKTLSSRHLISEMMALVQDEGPQGRMTFTYNDQDVLACVTGLLMIAIRKQMPGDITIGNIKLLVGDFLPSFFRPPPQQNSLMRRDEGTNVE